MPSAGENAAAATGVLYTWFNPRDAGVLLQQLLLLASKPASPFLVILCRVEENSFFFIYVLLFRSRRMATQQQQRRDVNHFQNYPIKFFFFSFEFYLMYTAALFFH